MELKGIVKSINDARTFKEGEELIREYFCTKRLTFGVSEILSGNVGDLDPGHKEADEVFFCVQGNVSCYFPEEDKYYELKKGDALLIPQNFGHKLFNTGKNKAIIIWCCAPHP